MFVKKEPSQPEIGRVNFVKKNAIIKLPKSSENQTIIKIPVK